jgi:hypothetical protein
MRSSTMLISDPEYPDRFIPRANDPWIRWGCRIFAFALDRRLALGRPPESGRLLAARAEQLVAPATRTALAENWRQLLEHAHRPARPRPTSRVPLCRDRVMHAEDEVGAVVSALTSTLPTPARGVAMASWILGDGTGPLYNRQCPRNLRAALRETAAHLDPMVSLAG